MMYDKDNFYDDNVDESDYKINLPLLCIHIGWNFAFSAGTVMLTSCYEVTNSTIPFILPSFITTTSLPLLHNLFYFLIHYLHEAN